MNHITKCLTEGGIPDGATIQNLVWLAQAHRRYAAYPHNRDRATWHIRWAALIEDVLEAHREHHH